MAHALLARHVYGATLPTDRGAIFYFIQDISYPSYVLHAYGQIDALRVLPVFGAQYPAPKFPVLYLRFWVSRSSSSQYI